MVAFRRVPEQPARFLWYAPAAVLARERDLRPRRRAGCPARALGLPRCGGLRRRLTARTPLRALPTALRNGCGRRRCVRCRASLARCRARRRCAAGPALPRIASLASSRRGPLRCGALRSSGAAAGRASAAACCVAAVRRGRRRSLRLALCRCGIR